MSTKELKAWLSRRRESRTLKKMREHILYVNSCITKAKDFYKFWADKDEEAAQNMYNLIHQEEKTADSVEAEIVDILTGGETPEYVRADLLSFTRMADKAAGTVKRGTKNLLLTIKHKFPEGIMKTLEDIFDLLAEEITSFIKVFDAMFKVEREELITLISNVNRIESTIDEKYGELKYKIANTTDGVSAGALIIFDHAIKDIEETSDLIEDCADMIGRIVLL